MDLYREEILDHYKHPRHFGHLHDPSLVYHDSNPFCGDEITLELKIEDGHVADVAFTGHGCAISRAAASMMSEEIIGKPLAELKEWQKEDITDMLGIEVGPVRMKCALLPLKALKAAVWGLGVEGEEIQKTPNRSDDPLRLNVETDRTQPKGSQHVEIRESSRVDEIAPGEKKIVEADGLLVVVVNLDGQFFAIEDVCTHDGGPLGEGDLEDGQIICPRHGAHFDVRTGDALTLPAFEPVPTFEVRVDGQDVLVETY